MEANSDALTHKHTFAAQFEDGSFDTIVDKGALDALMGEPGEAADTTGSALLRECCRVTADQGGTILIVSLLQAHVLSAVLHAFRAGWGLSIQQVPPMRDMATNKLQPFLVTAKALVGDGTRVPPVELLGVEAAAAAKAVNAGQLADIAALVATENEERMAGAASGGMPPGGDVYAAVHPGRTRVVALGSTNSSSPRLGPRFMATVVDAAGGSRPAAVFLVPQGREHEWLFAIGEGQQQLAANCSAQRLVIVCLGRGHAFGTSPAVQAELSPLVLPLLPLACRGTAAGAVPILSMADGLGSRTVVAQAASGLSGAVVVEDVTLHEEGEEEEGGPVTYRRLIFTATPTLVQSEMRMLGQAPAQGGVDLSHLCSAYHAAIIAGLGLTVPAFVPGSAAPAARPASVTVIGLGGGALPLFLVEHFPHVAVHVVELDPVVAQLAAEHFAFDTAAYDSRLNLTIGDGLRAVADIQPGGSVDAIVVDASDSDPSLGMTCPPAPFVEPPFLRAAAAGLSPDGSLVINVVTRSQEAFAATLAAVSADFPFVYQADMEDDVNRVLFARKTKATGNAADAAASLDAVALKPWSRSVLDIEALATGLRLLST